MTPLFAVRPAIKILAALCVGALAAACAATNGVTPTGTWEQTPHGIIVTPADGPAQQVRLVVMSDEIVRVTATPAESIDVPESLMVIDQPSGAFEVREEPGAVVLSTSEISAHVSLNSGAVRFVNSNGEVVLAEHDRGSFTPVNVQGENFYAVHQEFNRGTDEGFYGLGQHQNGQFNYNGEDVELAQHNIVDVVPFVVSTRNYGVLWENNGITRFGDPNPYQPLNAALRVYDAEGREGGLTGKYYRDDDLVVTRVEADPNYQYLPPNEFQLPVDQRRGWPEGEWGPQGPTRVTWEGSVEASEGGVHKFRLYASNYFKLWVDGELVFDRWRQNWNPWYHNFEITMQPGERHSIRIEWLPNAGYFRLDHRPPLPADQRHALSLSSEVAHAIDYYFINGDSMDDVIAGYRELTGPAVMLPRWAYGFWQSRQRYTNQQELVDVVREYRRRDIPLDNIVLDWFYWPEDAWGSHQFDAARFPNPRQMVDDVHNLNAQLMISVWPKFYPTTDNYRELDAGGNIYRRQIEMESRDWVGPGYANAFYDPYSERGRQVFWRQIQENLDVLGIDAWWMDATEPDSHSNLDYAERALRMGPTAMGPGAEFFNSYVLMQSRSIFEGEQTVDPNDRVFILTRSTFGGLQRYGSASWSGDITGRWDDYREQISAGVNLSLSGLPNWTHDIGGFAVEDRYTQQQPAHLEEWRELNMRWFQFGAFSPLFRSHGEFPYREIFNIAPDGSEVQQGMIWYDRLRYRLLPYIYTVAADTYHSNGSIMRALVMDFPDDANVRNLGEQYLFGPSFLVAPVTEFRARTREVYLPAGTRWYDFYTGAVHEGGQRLNAAAPLNRMPVFVRAGAIVPMGPQVEYSDENLGGPLTIYVYTGADGAFSLYEDDGETYAHQRGEFSRIPLSYDEESGVLSIGARQGSYPGMIQNRTIHVRWISGPNRNAVNFDARPDATVRYVGAAVTVQRR